MLTLKNYRSPISMLGTRHCRSVKNDVLGILSPISLLGIYAVTLKNQRRYTYYTYYATIRLVSIQRYYGSEYRQLAYLHWLKLIMFYCILL